MLLLAAVFSSGNLVLGAALNAFNHPLVPSLAQIVAALVTAVALAILLPKYGIMGAAAATLMAYGTATLYMILYASRRLRVRPTSLVPGAGDFISLWTYFVNRRADAVG